MPDRKKPDDGLSAAAGVALLDSSFRLIAADEGATAILSAIPADAATIAEQRRPAPPLPRVLREQMDGFPRPEEEPPEIRFRSGNHWYRARASVMTANGRTVLEPSIALYFQRDAASEDPLGELTLQCHLTEREREALSGIARGLTSKEVAHRMNISPSTVKTLLRLVKIKTGGRNRAAIVAKLLDAADRSRTADELFDVVDG
jgi:DNA-binding CsgD family transcriptional regulator